MRYIPELKGYWAAWVGPPRTFNHSVVGSTHSPAKSLRVRRSLRDVRRSPWREERRCRVVLFRVEGLGFHADLVLLPSPPLPPVSFSGSGGGGG